MTKRILIIGLDGGTWKIFKPMIDSGFMPNLKSLIDKGAFGVLNSTVPPVTAPAWTSFLTGVNPGKHGIYEFNNYRPGTYSTYFLNGSHISYKTIWDILSEHDKKVISINVPMTYPPKPVNGFLITGMLTPSIDVTYTYPFELKDEIVKIVNNYKIITTGKVYCLSGLKKFIDELIDTEQKRIKISKHLLQNSSWDVGMVHIQSTDIIQHYLYHIIDKKHSLHDNRNIERVYEFYQKIDDCIGDLIKVIPKNSLKIVMSDHGFRPVHKTVNLNAILEDEGYLKIKKNKKMLSYITKLVSNLLKYDRLNINRWLLGKKRRKMSEHITSLIVDFTKTSAFVTNGWVYGNIYINLEGREKNGIVKKEDYDSVRDSIINLIENVTDPETGEKIFNAYKKEDLFNNTKHVHTADIVVIPKGPYEFSGNLLFRKKEFLANNRIRRDHTGSHDKDGIIVFSGNDVIGKNIDADIVDVMPTILWYLELPIPEYVDGKVITSIFDKELLQNKTIKFSQVSEISTSKNIFYDENEEIRDRLKSLGYL